MIALVLALTLQAAPQAPVAPGVRGAAASFQARDLRGQRVRLDDLRGKVVVLAFWATWCAPCRQELTHLDALQRARGPEGLTVLAVATDGPETAAQVGALAQRNRFAMSVIHDADGALRARFNPRGDTPFVLLIDRQGRVAFTHAGYTPGDEVELARRVAAELATP